MLESVHLEQVVISDDIVVTTTDSVQLRLEQGAMFVTRKSVEEAGPRIVSSHRDDRIRPPTVRWVHDPGRAQQQFTVTATATLRPDAEVFQALSWFDDDPATMSPALRNSVLEQYFREIKGVTNKSLRWHVWRLAADLLRWHRRLQLAWACTVPPVEALHSFETFTLWCAESPQPVMQQAAAPVVTDAGAADFIRRRREKEMKRRLRKANSLGTVSSITERGWAALSAIAGHLKDHGTAMSGVFQVYLDNINARFSADVDYSDSSASVRNLREEGKMRSISTTMLEADERIYAAGGMRALYQSKVAAFIFNTGLKEDQLEAWLWKKAPSHCIRVMYLLRHGQLAAMLPSFKPNGFVGVKNNSLYESHKCIHEENAVGLWEAGKAALLRAPVVTADDKAQLMGYRVHPVPKFESMHRIVTHMSFGTAAHPSYNSSVNWEDHLSVYPRYPLVTVHQLADIACALRREFPAAGFLHGAVVDAKGAYEIFPVSFEKFLLLWSQLDICLDGEVIRVLKGAVAGMFGDAGAGDTWDIIAKCLGDIHNRASKLFKSRTYVDDMIIFAPPVISDVDPAKVRHFYFNADDVIPRVREGASALVPGTRYAIIDAVVEARENLACMAGPGSTTLKKTKIFSGFLEGIGWEFDLRYSHFDILPLRGKLDKIAHHLFNLTHEGVTSAPLTVMESITGLLCWFATAIPMGKAFVYSLFQCRRIAGGFVTIHPAAARDLTYWRALIRTALEDPHLVGCPLELLRTDRLPDCYIVNDACTGIGAGGWMSTSATWVPKTSYLWFILRWSVQEKIAIEARLLPCGQPDDIQWTVVEKALQSYTIPDGKVIANPCPKLTINVLEFAIAVFMIMMVAPLIAGKVVSISGDNTAALCWLVRNKSSSGAADTLLKLLSLTCVIYNIRLVAHHTRGVDNFLADWQSRVLGVAECDPLEVVQLVAEQSSEEFLRHMQDVDPTDRRSVCRRLLSFALINPDVPSVDTVIRMMVCLRDAPTVNMVTNSDIPFVMDAFQRLVDLNAHPYEGIPDSIQDAVIAAREWEMVV